VQVAGGGRGFLPRDGASEAHARHVDAARGAWDEAERILSTMEGPAVVVLDEVCYALAKDLLDSAAVRARLETRRSGVSVVCTGRGAPEWLRSLADTVSEIECRRHAFQDGVPATKGIEL
jgi:cob(I)alamin adenosyltransferase